jgi:type II secretory pathway component PulF
MEEEKLSAQIGPALTVGATHLFLVAVLIAFCKVRVPHYTDVFNDVAQGLPRVTEVVLGFGNFVAGYWYWLVPPILVFLAGDMLVFALIRKHRNESFARVWAWAVIGLLGMVLVGCWLALRLTLAGMTGGMPA